MAHGSKSEVLLKRALVKIKHCIKRVNIEILNCFKRNFKSFCVVFGTGVVVLLISNFGAALVAVGMFPFLMWLCMMISHVRSKYNI